MPQFTPAKATLAVAALLIAGLGVAYAAGLGADDSTPADDVSPTMTTSSTTRATDDPSSTASGSPEAPPASGATEPVPTQAAPTKAAPAPSSYSPRPTPTTTDVTTDMGPGAHDGDGE